jgi:myxalamid-type nonribosomal peptide synthetase MxaA
VTSHTAAARERLDALSEEKTRLLELLLESRSRRLRRISPVARKVTADISRVAASAAQQRLWFIDQLEEARAAYNFTKALRLQGDLDREALWDALGALVQRHETLRSVFVNAAGEIEQQIHAEGRPAWAFIDLSELTPEAREARVTFARHQELQEPFDLSAGPLLRVKLLRLDAQEHVLLLSLHHIIFDGWSMGILARELSHLYDARVRGHKERLPPLPIQYADYAEWQRCSLKSEAMKKQLSYWCERLQGAAPQLQLPTDRPRPEVQTRRGGIVLVDFDAALSAQLRALAKKHDVTVFMVLYAAWVTLLARLSGQDDILVGTPVANRPVPEVEGLIGLFVNTLVLRTRVTAELTVGELLEQVKAVTLGAYDHQDVPFEHVVDALHPQRALNRNPLFQVMLAVQNAPEGELHLAGVKVSEETEIDEPPKFDLLLSVRDDGERISGRVSYAADLYDRETIERWMESFRAVLASMQDVRCRVGALAMLREPQSSLIETFTRAERLLQPCQGLHELFEQQVRRTPDQVAVVYESRSLTYLELNSRANQLARHLQGMGVVPGDLAGLCISRSVEMFVGVLAILKAGAAYVPLDPDYPPERLLYIEQDASPRVVLIEESVRTRLSGSKAKLVCLQSDWDEIARNHAENLPVRAPQDALAYVIYTSGSTGRPKGVMIEHASVVNLWCGLEHAYSHPTACRHIALNASMSFDASVQQLLQLLCGRTVFILPQHYRADASLLLTFLDEYHIEGIDCTPSQLKSWINAGLLQQPRALRTVLVGGEAIDADLWATLANFQHIAFYNVYGPTECTVDATIARLEPSVSQPHIGRPMANRRVHILDDERRAVPVGVVGELYVGGVGVGRGYWNRPQLTAERFVPDPFDAKTGARLYKTGDLARWRGDGNIEYLGRNDDQVKIRGFRMELGEIEVRLSQHPDVSEAVVMAREDTPGDKRLVAYLTPRRVEGLTPSVEQLRVHMKAALPDYMVPSAFVVLERMPSTPSGKIDRRALPAPTLEAYTVQSYEAPQGETERQLADLWRELLNVERVGRRDSFFDLGGHSMLAVKALFLINQRLGASLKVTDLYGSPTLRELAARVRGDGEEQQFVSLSREAVLEEDIVAPPGDVHFPARAILLTGATGFVGRFLLAQLLQDGDARIYCLVRAASLAQAQERLKDTLVNSELWREEFASRMVVIRGDLRLPRLGLDDDTYEHLCRTVDALYHCATSMNHLETYSMAKAANVDAQRELLRIAARDRPKQFNQISTLSVFRAPAAGSRRVVDERESIDEETHPSSSGYAASKWVADKLCLLARERGISCNLFRLGFIWADSEHGRYDELQYAYRMLKSCLLTGCAIENYDYEIAPTPVDFVARAIVHFAHAERAMSGTFHLSSPDSRIKGLFERCNDLANTKLTLMPHYDWIREMKRRHHEGHALPVVPLIEYAFSMDESSFLEHQRSMRSAAVTFDCTHTLHALAKAGIVAPVLDDSLLLACLTNMLSTDRDLRALCERGRLSRPVAAHAASVTAKNHGGDRGELTCEQLQEMMRRMLRIRLFDERAAELRARLAGSLHNSIGQEAEIVGACMALREDDYMTGNHRSHGHPIGKGVALNPLMAELFGKVTGVCRGKGGSMHLAVFSVGSLGESGIVGSLMPIAVGAGLSAQLRGTDQVCLCFFGDGAANCGPFHESLNLAAVWRLPVVFLCENNRYALFTAQAESTAVLDVAQRAAAYGMPGVIVDGQDVLAVYKSVAQAVARARAGGGPTLIEAKTYRYCEHSEFGATEDLTPDAFAQMKREIHEEVEASISFAENSASPGPEELLQDVFIDQTGSQTRATTNVC